MNLGGTGCCCAYACFQRTHCSNTRYGYRFDRLGVSYLIFITLHIIDILFIFFFLRGQLIFGITSMKWRESMISPISSSRTIVTIVTRRCRTIPRSCNCNRSTNRGRRRLDRGRKVSHRCVSPVEPTYSFRVDESTPIVEIGASIGNQVELNATKRRLLL